MRLRRSGLFGVTIALASFVAATAAGTVAAAPVAPGGSTCVPVPAAEPGDVAMVNVTPVAAQGPGWGALRSSDDTPVTDRPSGERFSAVNFGAGDPAAPNLAIASVGADGTVCYDGAGSSAHVVLDSAAVLDPDEVEVVASRVLDTRSSAPVSASASVCADIPAGEPGDLVFVNVTNTSATGVGWGALRPSDGAPVFDRPIGSRFSSVNFAAGTTPNPNLGATRIGTDGRVCYDNAVSSAHVILDVFAVVAADVSSDAGRRLLDTRGGPPMSPSSSVCVDAGDASPGDVAVINVTNTSATGNGWGAVRPSDAPAVVDQPTALQYSAVNFAAGTAPDPNLAVARVGPDGRVCYDHAVAGAHVILDLTAILGGSVASPAQTRLLDTRIEACADLTGPAPFTECAALAAIHSIGNLPLADLTDGRTDPCTWPGTICDADGVVGLDTGDLFIDRPRGPDFWYRLTGPFPDDVAALPRLRTLSLDRNEITSLPPEIGRLTDLRELAVGGNDLGSLPPEIGDLTNLRLLRADFARLGSIPDEIGDLTNLETLVLNRNFIEELPDTIGDLDSLRTLVLGQNRLPELTPSIGGLDSLVLLDLGGLPFEGNQLSRLPAEIGQLDTLETLVLSGNSLSSLPATISGLTSLEWLDLGENRLTEFPLVITELDQLRVLDLAGTGSRPATNLITEIPAEIDLLGELEHLDVSLNRLTTLPTELGQLPQLLSLRVDLNLIGGDLTSSMSALRAGAPALEILRLRGIGCPFVTDPDVEAWIELFDPRWNIPDGSVVCPPA